jgi:CheY-like chemotaxis protein
MESQFKILVIDTKTRDKETVQENLPELQFKVQSAQNFDQIKEYLKKDIPDLLLLSSELPKIDPFKTCERFSRAGFGVILLSDEITHRMVIKAYRCGAVDLLVQPLKPGVIHQRIERALGRIGKRPPEKEALKIDFGTAAKPRERVEILIEKIDELLALPFAVTKIIRLCNDPKTNAQNLERPAQSDPAIGAMIMRRANSAAYGGAQKITSFQMAVVRLGMKTTRNIATSLSVFKLFSKEEKSFGFNRLWFWVHALSAGICARSR